MEIARKVVLGMSGGVDSAVAAFVLQQKGFDVVGLFMNNWQEDEHCPSEQDWADVQGVCGRLGIPHYSVSFAKQYYDQVFAEFLRDYSLGLTPNPDVLCNRQIKFGVFADYARRLGADFIATGHYARLRGDQLCRPKDGAKDQTYFLAQVKTEQFRDVLFPLADMTKDEVRRIAHQLGLVVKDKRDSTGVCFVGERNFRQFLAQFFPSKEGDIVDLEGNIVGRHIGLEFYTLGQRRGLAIGGRKGVVGRWFVAEKRLQDNTLVVSCGNEDCLFSRCAEASEINFIGAPPPSEFECTAKFRYRQQDCAVSVSIAGSTARIAFAQPQRAVTPGQFAVFYDGERCLGSAKILKTEK